MPVERLLLPVQAEFQEPRFAAFVDHDNIFANFDNPVTIHRFSLPDNATVDDRYPFGYIVRPGQCLQFQFRIVDAIISCPRFGRGCCI